MCVHREVLLALSDGVHQLGAVPVRRVICIAGRHLDHRGTCQRDTQAVRETDKLSERQTGCQRDRQAVRVSDRLLERATGC